MILNLLTSSVRYTAYTYVTHKIKWFSRRQHKSSELTHVAMATYYALGDSPMGSNVGPEGESSVWLLGGLFIHAYNDHENLEVKGLSDCPHTDTSLCSCNDPFLTVHQWINSCANSHKHVCASSKVLNYLYYAVLNNSQGWSRLLCVLCSAE